MRLTLCDAPTRETRLDRNTGNYVPYSFRRVCGFSVVPANYEDAEDGAYGLQSISENT